MKSRILILLVLSQLITSTTIAQKRWDGEAADGEWNSGRNWYPDGIPADNEPATAGTNNFGGGGGGGSGFNNSPGGPGSNGGTGVVIIRMPTANYSGTVTGSPTVTTSGADTIITFTGTGTIKA
jgi:hypothetical protein